MLVKAGCEVIRYEDPDGAGGPRHNAGKLL